MTVTQNRETDYVEAYLRLSARDRIADVADADSFIEWDADLALPSPYFHPGYDDKKAQHAKESGELSAVLCGSASIGGNPVALVVMDSYFMMGSMGTTEGEKIARAIDRACRERLPLVVFSASGGARMQEGLCSLLQMAKISCALTQLAEAGVLFISVLTDPTTGGVFASFASQGDIILAEAGARIGFAGRRLIEETYRSPIPDDFQTADYMLQCGLIDMVITREAVRGTLANLLELHRSKRSTSRGSLRMLGHPGTRQTTAEFSTWKKIELLRRHDRPSSRQYINALISDFHELSGDRLYGDDKAVIAGIGYISQTAVTVIAFERGTDIKERVECNFGCARPEGYRKAIRIARQAEKFARPVICFIDTQGADCSVDSENRGQGNAISECLMVMAQLKTPTISIIIGEGGSGGALALALTNTVAMLEHAVYSICSPEAFANILWKDPKRAEEASAMMRMTAQQAFELGVCDEVIYEPEGGSNTDPGETARRIGDFLDRELARYSAFDIVEIVSSRQERYRSFMQYV